MPVNNTKDAFTTSEKVWVKAGKGVRPGNEAIENVAEELNQCSRLVERAVEHWVCILAGV
jgi:hypothetical protein